VVHGILVLQRVAELSLEVTVERMVDLALEFLVTEVAEVVVPLAVPTVRPQAQMELTALTVSMFRGYLRP
jgi:hypothetical protein